MTIPEILTLLDRLIATLKAERTTVFSSGNISRLVEIDGKIAETETSIAQLRTLL